jgi:hypothetical protein
VVLRAVTHQEDSKGQADARTGCAMEGLAFLRFKLLFCKMECPFLLDGMSEALALMSLVLPQVPSEAAPHPASRKFLSPPKFS